MKQNLIFLALNIPSWVWWGFFYTLFMFLYIEFFSITNNDDSQDNSVMEGAILISLYNFHPLTNIQTFTCNFASEIINSYFSLHRTRLSAATRWDLSTAAILDKTFVDFADFVSLHHKRNGTRLLFQEKASTTYLTSCWMT